MSTHSLNEPSFLSLPFDMLGLIAEKLDGHARASLYATCKQLQQVDSLKPNGLHILLHSLTIAEAVQTVQTFARYGRLKRLTLVIWNEMNDDLSEGPVQKVATLFQSVEAEMPGLLSHIVSLDLGKKAWVRLHVAEELAAVLARLCPKIQCSLSLIYLNADHDTSLTKFCIQPR